MGENKNGQTGQHKVAGPEIQTRLEDAMLLEQETVRANHRFGFTGATACESHQCWGLRVAGNNLGCFRPP